MSFCYNHLFIKNEVCLLLIITQYNINRKTIKSFYIVDEIKKEIITFVNDIILLLASFFSLRNIILFRIIKY